MRYVAAYCLFALSGKTPTAKDLEKMLGSVGVDCDAEQAKKVVSELDGKDLDELIREGMSKLGTMPAGGGGGGAAAAPAAGGGSAAPAAEPAKEAKKEEPEEESDDDMGFGLFD